MRCSFCSLEVERGTGKLYVTKDGNVYPFCSSKCEKNQFKLGRAPQFTTWTTRYQKAKKAVKKTAQKEGAKK